MAKHEKIALDAVLADIHRALHQELPDSTFFFDVIETRLLLGL